MTDLEQVVAAWDLWARRSAAVSRGLRLGPLVTGAVATCVLVYGPALQPLLG